MFRKILIANRGEIACRIARTCRRMGIQAATIHSTADRDALHVREIGESIEVGSAAPAESYLAIPKIVAAAKRLGADAVHPGYGFLSESPAFAAALAAAGIAFIGPGAEVLACFGDKAAAKAEASAAGLPLVPGSEGPLASPEEVKAAAAKLRFPLLLKPAGGGGGKGMRVAATFAVLPQETAAAMREAKGAFGDPRLILEEYLPHARHIEVQILGDGRGGVIHLFDRECSLQRRHQKVIEEAPVSSLPEALRSRILDHATRLGRAAKYLGLGTVEFIVSGDKVYFLEVNPRLQVEHPVTEAVTGLDLVELQIRTIAEGALPLRQADVTAAGCAIEARLYAEDPANNFLPAAGTVTHLRLPANLRVDAGIAEGMEITPYYDPMIAKLIASGQTREEAHRNLAEGLDRCAVGGITTNLAFLQRLLARPEVRANDIHTGTIEEIGAADAEPAPSEMEAAIAAAFWLKAHRDRGTASVWESWTELTGWRLGTGERTLSAAPALRLRAGDKVHEIRFGAMDGTGILPVAVGESVHEIRLTPGTGGSVIATADDLSLALVPEIGEGRAGFLHRDRRVGFSVEPYLSGARLIPGKAGDGSVRAPMMGRIVEIRARLGQRVEAGERLAIMDSMKMELSLSAPMAGTLAEIRCAADTTVERDAVVFVIRAAPEATT